MEYFTLMKGDAKLINIIDWMPGSARQSRPALMVVCETLTAGELIERRVREECEAFNALGKRGAQKADHRLDGSLVVPAPEELKPGTSGHARAPGYPARSFQSADPQKQIAIAREAFERGEFIMLFDGAQIDDWNQRIPLGDGSEATFIRLVQLVGG